MSNIFEDRERGYEAKWAHDEEMHFRVMARRNALLGSWAAAALGLSGAKKVEYAQHIIRTGLAGKGKDPVLEKIRDDFRAGNVGLTDQVIHDKMKQFFEAASRELTVP